MATLSGQTIQSTYQGLLKLADSTSGLTSTLQSLEDGLGNATTMKVSTGRTNIDNYYSYQNLKPRYTGLGIGSATGVQQAAGTQNILQAFAFYDTGIYSYSAMTYRVGTITSTSDVLEVAFYTAQSGVNGLYPAERVGSVQTLTGLTSATEQTIPFSGGNISFSGTGSGVYFLMAKYSNSGVQPTVRFIVPFSSFPSTQFEGASLGVVPSLTAGAYVIGLRYNGNRLVFSGASTFDSSFSYSTITSAQSSTASIAGGAIGFHLHVNNF
jgi:hypothetical protein